MCSDTFFLIIRIVIVHFFSVTFEVIEIASSINNSGGGGIIVVVVVSWQWWLRVRRLNM